MLQNWLVGGAPGAPVLPMPVSFAIGASTCGVRMPPRTLPCESVAKTTGETPGAEVAWRRGAIGGGVPNRAQRSIQLTAASKTQCIGPVLIGRAHSMTPGDPSVG